MSETSKHNIIRHSLLFTIIIDALPYYEYDSAHFESHEPWYIEHIMAKLNVVDIDVHDFALQKKGEQEAMVDDLLNRRFQNIIKQEYAKRVRQGLTVKKRQNILRRDRHICQYCGARLDNSIYPPTVDHIKPIRSGGTHSSKNLVACCLRCNVGKKDFNEFVYEDRDLKAAV